MDAANAYTIVNFYTLLLLVPGELRYEVVGKVDMGGEPLKHLRAAAYLPANGELLVVGDKTEKGPPSAALEEGDDWPAIEGKMGLHALGNMVHPWGGEADGKEEEGGL